MQFQVQKRDSERAEVQPEFERVGDDMIIGSTVWLGDDGRRHEHYQVITLRDGKIADMQSCASPRQAHHFARRRTVPT